MRGLGDLAVCHKEISPIPFLEWKLILVQKMLESRSEDALVLLVKLVKSTVMTVETAETAETVEAAETVLIEDLKKYRLLTHSLTH